jgi:hypothetical protein
MECSIATAPREPSISQRIFSAVPRAGGQIALWRRMRLATLGFGAFNRVITAVRNEGDGLDGRHQGRRLERHTLLWELQGQECVLIECEAWKDRDAVLVRVKQGGNPDRTHTFRDCADAVNWALTLERTLVDRGWKKRI